MNFDFSFDNGHRLSFIHKILNIDYIHIHTWLSLYFDIHIYSFFVLLLFAIYRVLLCSSIHRLLLYYSYFYYRWIPFGKCIFKQSTFFYFTSSKLKKKNLQLKLGKLYFTIEKDKTLRLLKIFGNILYYYRIIDLCSTFYHCII